jgi:hypothetical protein
VRDAHPTLASLRIPALRIDSASATGIAVGGTLSDGLAALVGTALGLAAELGLAMEPVLGSADATSVGGALLAVGPPWPEQPARTTPITATEAIARHMLPTPLPMIPSQGRRAARSTVTRRNGQRRQAVSGHPVGAEGCPAAPGGVLDRVTLPEHTERIPRRS